MRIETDRLCLSPLCPEDAGFILSLVNDPDWLRYIGDKGVRTLDDATGYILDGPVKSYAANGFGLLAVRRKNDDLPVGICGLLKRETLNHPDLGFAFLPAFRSRGYAPESASAVIAHARDKLGFSEVLAITKADNNPSIHVLEKLGFRYRQMIDAPGDAPGRSSRVRLYRRRL